MDISNGIKTPLFGGTIAVRKDCILLAGGIDSLRQRTVGNVYSFNFAQNSLLRTGEFNVPRNSFALAKIRDRIIAVGGCNEIDGRLSSCESCMLTSNPNKTGSRWDKIASLKYPCTNPCVVSMQDSFLVKFGGQFDITFDQKYFIELYCLELNEWFPVNVVLKNSAASSNPNERGFMNHLCETVGSGGIQVADWKVLIMGGLGPDSTRS